MQRQISESIPIYSVTKSCEFTSSRFPQLRRPWSSTTSCLEATHVHIRSFLYSTPTPNMLPQIHPSIRSQSDVKTQTDRAGLTEARPVAFNKTANKQHVLVKMLPLLSATLSPGFSRYFFRSSSSVSTQCSTSYTADVVFSYLKEQSESLSYSKHTSAEKPPSK